MPLAPEVFHPDGTFNYTRAKRKMAHLLRPDMTDLIFRTVCLEELLCADQLELFHVNYYFDDLPFDKVVARFTLPVELIERHMDKIVAELINGIIHEYASLSIDSVMEMPIFKQFLAGHTTPHPVFNLLYEELVIAFELANQMWAFDTTMMKYDVQLITDHELVRLFTLDFLYTRFETFAPDNVLVHYPLHLLETSAYIAHIPTVKDVKNALYMLTMFIRTGNTMTPDIKSRLLFLQKVLRQKRGQSH